MFGGVALGRWWLTLARVCVETEGSSLSASNHYSDVVKANTFKWAIMDQLAKCKSSLFGDVILRHFQLRRKAIMQSLTEAQAAEFVHALAAASMTAA
mgnify:FL=1